MSTLLRQNSDKLETVQKPHAMADDGPERLKLGHFWDGKLKRDHFTGAELAGYDRPEPVFREFKAAAVNAEISLLPQNLDDQRQFGTVAGITPCRGLVHALTFLQLGFLPDIAPGEEEQDYRHKNLQPWQGVDTEQ